MSHIFAVRSPLCGWVLPLSDVPDPVFSQGMAGDGLAIDPTSDRLCAPCSGTVIFNPGMAHACTVRTQEGVELLLHVGIDTVLLKNAGFQRLVDDGESVVTGQALIQFDLDYIVQHAASAVTPILLTSPNARIISRYTDGEISYSDVLYEYEASEFNHAESSNGDILIQKITVALSHGLHARPAARLAGVLRTLDSDVEIRIHDKAANARSMVAVMALGVAQYDEIECRVKGDDAQETMRTLQAFFSEGSPAKNSDPIEINPKAEVPTVDGRFHGVVASAGLAVGSAFHLKRKKVNISETGQGVETEMVRLQQAIERFDNHLRDKQGKEKGSAAEILEAHRAILNDPELQANCRAIIRNGCSADYAWQQATASVINTLQSMNNAYMRERTADFEDVAYGMLNSLAGADFNKVDDMPEQAIVLVDELLPSQLLGLDVARVAGICSSAGGAGSHASILAASMAIPFLIAAGNGIHEITEGDILVLDAENGYLQAYASDDELAETRIRIARRMEVQRADRDAAHQPTRSRDGIGFIVKANLGSVNEVRIASESGAQGCGLFRTEFLFLDRATAPSEQEQFEIYRSILAEMPDVPITIRTMDIGGDKPIPYLALPAEDNPALGLRGLRTSLWRDALFDTQLRALLRAGCADRLHILLPMINDPTEIAIARQYIERCARDLDVADLPKLGAMIETPASALMVEQILENVEFVSIGSNDLSQYVLAIDRGHSALASKLDGLHPAVLKMIAHVAEAGIRAGKPVSLCGGLASDPVAIALLFGIGITEFSAVPSMIPRIKRLIRSMDFEQCRTLAMQAMQEPDAVSVRKLAIAFLDNIETGGRA